MAFIGSALTRLGPGTIRSVGASPRTELLVALTLALACGILIATGRGGLALAIAIGLPTVALVLHYPFAGILIWLIAMPFAGLGASGPQASTILWICHRLAVPALLALVLSYHFLRLRRSPFRLGAIDAALALFLILGTANILLFTSQPTRQFVEFYDHLAVPIALFWLIRLLAPGPVDLRRLLPIAIAMIAFQTTVAALSWVAPSVLPSAWLGREGERAVGTFGGPGPYTIVLVLFALLLVFFASMARTDGRRRWLLAVVAVALGGVILSLSRGSWLGASAAFAGLVFLYPRMAAGVSAAAVVVVALIALGPLGPVLSRVGERVDYAETADARLVTNFAAIRMVADRPLFGFGFNNFELFDEGYKQAVGDIPLIPGGSNHNSYLGLAAELGLPAALAYGVPPAGLLLLTLRYRGSLRSHPASRTLVVVLWLALLDQFLVSNFTDTIHSSAWATSLWWITLGLIAVELNRVRVPAVRPVESQTHARGVPIAQAHGQAI